MSNVFALNGSSANGSNTISVEGVGTLANGFVNDLTPLEFKNYLAANSDATTPTLQSVSAGQPNAQSPAAVLPAIDVNQGGSLSDYFTRGVMVILGFIMIYAGLRSFVPLPSA